MICGNVAESVVIVVPSAQVGKGRRYGSPVTFCETIRKSILVNELLMMFGI